MNVKAWIRLLAAAFLPLGLSGALAQPPAKATGICKDGTYSTASAKDGACRGHKGVQTWYSAPVTAEKATEPLAPAPVNPPAPTAPAAEPKPGIAAERARLASMQAAPGGGPGLVWLNGSSKVYHCPSSEFYGKTKNGAYLPEAEAKARGAHPNHNKPCT